MEGHVRRQGFDAEAPGGVFWYCGPCFAKIGGHRRHAYTWPCSDGLRELVGRLADALGALVDNADGYDRSNLGAAIVQLRHAGNPLGLCERLHDLEINGRKVWREASALLDAAPGPE